ELQRVEDSAALTELRVYPSRKLRSYYPQLNDPEDYDVSGRKIKVRGALRPHLRTLRRGTPGKVVQEQKLGGSRMFWVSFSRACKDAGCAYGFVQTEYDRWSLVAVPRLETYKEPVSYRRNRLRRNRLRLGRQRAMNELNEVLVVPRRIGRAKTVDLQIFKDVFRPTLKTRSREEGVEIPD
ncbi:MAG TPA: hypothetical protein VGB85_06750, partial [Nannocystis sp.]